MIFKTTSYFGEVFVRRFNECWRSSLVWSRQTQRCSQGGQSPTTTLTRYMTTTFGELGTHLQVDFYLLFYNRRTNSRIMCVVSTRIGTERNCCVSVSRRSSRKGKKVHGDCERSLSKLPRSRYLSKTRNIGGNRSGIRRVFPTTSAIVNSHLATV